MPTQPHSLAHRYSCVALRMRLRESVRHVSFFNKSSEFHARHASVILLSVYQMVWLYMYHANVLQDMQVY